MQMRAAATPLPRALTTASLSPAQRSMGHGPCRPGPHQAHPDNQPLEPQRPSVTCSPDAMHPCQAKYPECRIEASALLSTQGPRWSAVLAPATSQHCAPATAAAPLSSTAAAPAAAAWPPAATAPPTPLAAASAPLPPRRPSRSPPHRLTSGRCTSWTTSRTAPSGTGCSSCPTSSGSAGT